MVSLSEIEWNLNIFNSLIYYIITSFPTWLGIQVCYLWIPAFARMTWIWKILHNNYSILLPKAQRLIGKEVIFMTKRRQYIPQGLFGFFYVKQYPNIKYNQISSHITIKLSKRAVMRHVFKRAIMHSVQKYDLVKYPIKDSFYKFFIVLSKNRIQEIQQKIANFSKKDTIKYIQAEFEKSRKWMTEKLPEKKN